MPQQRPWLILDVSTAPVHGVESFIEPVDTRSAPANFVDPVKIQNAKVESFNADVEKAATDIDLAQITGVSIWNREHGLKVAITLGVEENERKLLMAIARRITLIDPEIFTYNGRAFDLPLLMRRALYLGVDFPTISMDRYRSPHFDLYETLSYNGTLKKTHTMSWYMRRLGYTDLQKPLTGEQESKILTPEFNNDQGWALLSRSLEHDALALGRMAAWMGLIPHADIAQTGPVAPPPDPGV